MNLDVRFGTLFNEEANTSCLIAGKILIHDASAGQNQSAGSTSTLLQGLLERLESRIAMHSANEENGYIALTRRKEV